MSVRRVYITCEIDAEGLAPGDILLLESGDSVPADIRLLATHDLEIDESLLTGESAAVQKKTDRVFEASTFIGERSNMAFAGTMVNRGRGTGVVVATALSTELGSIATEVIQKPAPRAPLQVRMQIFTHRITIVVGIAAAILAVISPARGMPVTEIFMLTVALAVSVIPEGLPVALTVALAIGMRRMAQRHVIIRRLIAVEALFLASVGRTAHRNRSISGKDAHYPDTGSGVRVTRQHKSRARGYGSYPYRD